MTDETTDETTPRTQADSGWKDIIPHFVEQFFQFYFPDIHAAIDFSTPPRFLDTVLNEIMADAESRGAIADRLLEAKTRSGGTQWLLIHIEVQGYRDSDFAKRMFTTYYRVLDRYDRDVVSLVVFTDDSPAFRPAVYERGILGCGLTFRYPTVKLLDYRERVTELEQSDNPFAIVTLSELGRIRTQQSPEERLVVRKSLTDRLRSIGYSMEDIRTLYRFIGSVLVLPKPQILDYIQFVKQLQEDDIMPFVTDTEMIAEERGKHQGELQGLRESVIDALEIRFGEIPYALREAVNRIASEKRLKRLHRLAITVKSLDDFKV